MMNTDQRYKFKEWLKAKGVEILPTSNEYEELRFRGSETGVIYKSGKTANSYTNNAISAFLNHKPWDGGPINLGRQTSYRKQKKQLLVRDGSNCFYCDEPMGGDMTLEHLIPLVAGGTNLLGNMVLAHEDCNNEMGHRPVSEKVRYAIDKRIEKYKYETIALPFQEAQREDRSS